MSTGQLFLDFVGFTSSKATCLFVHIPPLIYCAPELLNYLAATSLLDTQYEPKHSKALKVKKNNWGYLFSCFECIKTWSSSTTKSRMFFLYFIFLMKAEVFYNRMFVEL